MTISRLYVLLVLVLPMNLWSQEHYPDSILNNRINAALTRQLDIHPYSEYRDIYKNFMQDYFGPGHILSDTVAAKNYLQRELSLEEEFGGPLYEPTGYEGNFYRVNLSLIRDKIIPMDIFFGAFVSSVESIVAPEPEIWEEKWGEIDEVIRGRGFKFDNEEKDREDIAAGFAQRKYIFHHTKKFNERSHYHYRIISREQFMAKIRPYLTN